MLGIGGFLRVHICGAPFVNDAMNIAQPYIFTAQTQFQQHIQACNPRSPAAGGHNLDIFNLFVRNQQGVFRSRPHNNRGSVLIIVKHRDIHAFTAQFFNDKTIRRFDIL